MRDMLVKALIALALVGAVGAVALMVYIRVTPIDPDRVHRDPMTVSDPGPRGVLLRGDTALISDLSPTELMAVLHETIGAAPRTEAVAGSVEAGHVTYITRSLFWGFPDALSLKVVPSETGSAAIAYGRSIYGGYDWNSNRARVERWFAAANP